MKRFIAVLFVGTLFTVCTYAQSPVVAPAPAPVVEQVAIEPAPVPTVTIAEPLAPPKWGEEALLIASKLPVIGPYVPKALFLASVIVSILTAMVTTLIFVINSLMLIVAYTPLAGLVVSLQNFKDGKFMYYLKLFSMFNTLHPKDQALLNSAKLNAPTIPKSG